MNGPGPALRLGSPKDSSEGPAQPADRVGPWLTGLLWSEFLANVPDDMQMSRGVPEDVQISWHRRHACTVSELAGEKGL